MRTEATLPFPSLVRQVITGKLDAHGSLTAHFDMTMRGDDEVLYRSIYHAAARAQWQAITQRISSNMGYAGDVSNVDASLPEKTAEPFHVSWDYTRKDFGDWDDRRIPGLSTLFQEKFADDATAPKRAMRLDPTGKVEVTVTLTLPEGYTLQAPADVHRTTAFADYSSSYKVKGGVFQMDRAIQYKTHELPPGDFGAYRDFLKGVSDDASQMLQLVGVAVQAPVVAEAQDSAQAANSASAPQQAQPPSQSAEPADAAPKSNPDPQHNAIASAWIFAAEQKMRTNDLAGASQLLEQARTLNDHERGLWLVSGDLESRRKETEQAIIDYRREAARYPDDITAHARLTYAYQRTGDWVDSAAEARAWAKASPSDTVPCAALGYTLMMTGQYREAADAYQEALSRSHPAEMLKVQLGRAQLRSGQTEAGKATLETLLQHSGDASLLNDAAYELGDANLDLAMAEQAAQRAITMESDRTAAVALDTATDSDLTLMPRLAASWDTLGWIYFKQHRLVEAEDYVRCAWLLGNHDEVGLHLGDIYAAEGKKSEAIAIYRMAAGQISSAHPWPYYAQMRQQLLAKAASLQGVASSTAPEQDASVSAELRTYTISNPVSGAAATGEFLLHMTGSRVDGVRFLRGDPSLKLAGNVIEDVTYKVSVPEDSTAKFLRRATLICTPGEPTCTLHLRGIGSARIGS